MSQRITLPPPADGVKFTIRHTWAQSIGFIEHEDFSEPVELFEPAATRSAMRVPIVCRIDPEDPDCWAMHLAWAHVMQVFDPFQSV